MIQIPDLDLFIGSRVDYNKLEQEDWVFVHVTQTIHYKLMEWDWYQNEPDKSHPCFIIYENHNRLSLNWVDGSCQYFEKMGSIDIFIQILDFIDKWIDKKKVLIHCDHGESRSPTIGLLYLAKRLKMISNSSFQDAKRDFIKFYPGYSPSGIASYVEKIWEKIV